jgi:GTPase involved in cell partitioning and DNA repair
MLIISQDRIFCDQVADEAIITVAIGKGGDGCLPLGVKNTYLLGPCGGDGDGVEMSCLC